MNTSRVAAIALIILGVLGLAYGGFTYTSDTHGADLGPFRMSFDEKEHVSIPTWVGAGAIAIGGLLFFFGSKRR